MIINNWWKIILENGVQATNIYVENKKISDISNEILEANDTIRANDLYISSVVDPHVHLDDSGFKEVEDFYKDGFVYNRLHEKVN